MKLLLVQLFSCINISTVNFFQIQSLWTSHIHRLWIFEFFFWFFRPKSENYAKIFLFTGLWTEIHRLKVTFTVCELCEQKDPKMYTLTQKVKFCENFLFTELFTEFTDLFTGPEFEKIYSALTVRTCTRCVFCWIRAHRHIHGKGHHTVEFL